MDRRRTTNLNVRVGEDEADMLKTVAERAGVSASDVVRQSIRQAYGEAVPSGGETAERKPFIGKVSFQTGRPVLLEPGAMGPDPYEERPEDRAAISKVVAVAKRYAATAKELCEGVYKDLANVFPPHLRLTCKVYFFLCPDGLIVRYEASPPGEVQRWFAAYTSMEVATLLPSVSESFVFGARDGRVVGSATPGLELTLFSEGPDKRRVPQGPPAKAFGVVKLDGQSPSSEGRPRPLASVTSTMTTRMVLEEIDEAGAPIQKVIVQSKARLPLGWECIEVYRRETLDAAWDPEAAVQWATDDLRALVANYHIERSQLLAIDPKAEVRAQYAALLAEFQSVVDTATHEEPVHQFLKKNPHLLCPDHTGRFWSKLRLGARDTDFVFQQAPGDRYLFVEIEWPQRELFREDGQPAEPLTHAIHQTTDWLRYLSENPYTVRHELGLKDIHPRVPCLIVMGRSRDLTPENRRTLATMTQGTGVTVMTYDDLIASTKSVIEHLVGPLWATNANSTVYYVPNP